MKNLLLLCILFICTLPILGQNAIGIHQEHSEEYSQNGFTSEDYYQINTPQAKIKKARNCTLEKIVYGWHPYWSNGLQTNYDWDLLSHFVYFSYEVDVNTGNALTTYNFATTQSVTDALNNGVDVHLCVTLFNNHATFFSNPTAQQTLITNLITLVQNRGAHGVNIDFESMASGLSADFTAFMINLCNQMHSAIPGSEVTVALHAVDWSGFYDLETLNDYVDLFIIMGYDYYWSGSANAGPNDPLFHFNTTYNYTLSRSTTFYEFNGVPKEKLILGLPYYGRDWPVSSHTLPASTTGSGTARTYKVVKDNASGFFSAANRNFEPESRSVFYNYSNGGLRQCFISEEDELSERMDFLNKRGLGGMGIWALGYDDGYTQLWDAISDNLTTCKSTPCSGTLSDIGGGPFKNYYSNENYEYTLSPDNAQSITVEFTSFSTELGYDFLYIYDGNSTASPQISGSPFSGTNSPGTFTTTSGDVTFRFVSDISAESSGWVANYTCQADNTPPTTVINVPDIWYTTDFEAEFTDEDNVDGSGIDRLFYSVHALNDNQWRANNQRGFFNDDFTTEIHSDWTVNSGTWQIVNDELNQSDENLGNTNISSSLKQDLSNRYLYKWRGKMEGSGTNRRAGFHFFSDNSTLPNHNNSYFVWFRLDNQKIQFYKVVGDNFGSPVIDIPQVFEAGIYYDFVVIYDRITGEVKIYIDNVLKAQWTDSAPYSNGDYIGFRSGNCSYTVDDFQVFRTRYPSVTVTVGEEADKDIQFQNPNPVTPSGRISSAVTDVAKNLSDFTSVDVDIDWTKPIIEYVNDGLAEDQDNFYVLGETSANWSSTDEHSGIAAYRYCIGETPFSDDIVSWTQIGVQSNVQVVDELLVYDTWYYFTLAVENGAGLLDTISSNGFRIFNTADISDLQFNEIPLLYPNPASNQFSIQSGLIIEHINVIDYSGKLVLTQEINAQNHTVDCSSWAKGIYFVQTQTGKGMVELRLVVGE